MRILSSEELSAVIGHELGHFRGKDTKFSLRFYPIYTGTIRALAALENESNTGTNSLALIPAMAVLSFFMEQFARSERTIGRTRELEADKAGVSISSSRALATSLLKIGAFAPLWVTIQSAMIKALNSGKSYANVSTIYAEMAIKNNNPALLDEIADSATTHPTDTHPPTTLRIETLGLSVAELRDSALNIDVHNSSTNLLSSVNLIEEELTQIEHDVLLHHGMAKLPEIESDSIDKYDRDGYTPLMRAVLDFDYERVCHLLSLGANPSKTDLKFGTTSSIDLALRLLTTCTDSIKKDKVQNILEVLQKQTVDEESDKTEDRVDSKKKAVAEGHCPECGEPININRSICRTCRYDYSDLK